MAICVNTCCMTRWLSKVDLCCLDTDPSASDTMHICKHALYADDYSRCVFSVYVLRFGTRKYMTETTILVATTTRRTQSG